MTMLGSKKESEHSNLGYTPPPTQNNQISKENLSSSESPEKTNSVDDLPFSN